MRSPIRANGGAIIDAEALRRWCSVAMRTDRACRIGVLRTCMPALATKKTGCQLVEGLSRKAHFPPVHARFHLKQRVTVPNSYTTMRGGLLILRSPWRSSRQPGRRHCRCAR